MSTGETTQPALEIDLRDEGEEASAVDEPRREVYTHGYSPQVAGYMAARSADRQAGFILPHLRVGMRLLDCGCGPGSITVDLAAAIAPGQVEGIDIGATQIAAARARATERRITNVQFQVADIYKLPFPTGLFDVVFAHAVIQHLRDPLRALGEMRRVLTPGGIVGLRDDDWGTVLFEPSTPLLRLWQSLMVKVWAHNGGDPFIGRKHRRLLNEAGFMRTQASSSAESYGTLEATSAFSTSMVEHHRAAAFARVVLEQGWADQRELEAMYREVLSWGERDDAFFSYTFCETIGWKSEDAAPGPEGLASAAPL
jgi:ubiquinone/menaquinone biosynthesis C-methylase UbiE